MYICPVEVKVFLTAAYIFLVCFHKRNNNKEYGQLSLLVIVYSGKIVNTDMSMRSVMMVIVWKNLVRKHILENVTTFNSLEDVNLENGAVIDMKKIIRKNK